MEDMSDEKYHQMQAKIDAMLEEFRERKDSLNPRKSLSSSRAPRITHPFNEDGYAPLASYAKLRRRTSTQSLAAKALPMCNSDVKKDGGVGVRGASRLLVTHFHKKKPLRRGGGAGEAAVGGEENFAGPSLGTHAAADFDQRAHDRTNHVVEKTVGHDVENDPVVEIRGGAWKWKRTIVLGLEATAVPTNEPQTPAPTFGRYPLAAKRTPPPCPALPRRTSSEKIVRTLVLRLAPDDSKLVKSCFPTSDRAARCMASASSRPFCSATSNAAEKCPAPPVVDQVAIMFAFGAISRMKIGRDFAHVEHGDIVRQHGVQRFLQNCSATSRLGAEAGHLAQGVDAGVGPSAGREPHLFSGDLLEGRFERYLDRFAIRLDLPAEIVGAVVSDGEFERSHGENGLVAARWERNVPEAGLATA